MGIEMDLIEKYIGEAKSDVIYRFAGYDIKKVKRNVSGSLALFDKDGKKSNWQFSYAVLKGFKDHPDYSLEVIKARLKSGELKFEK
jgi:hypothetical protein